MKNLGSLSYFLGIEVSYPSSDSMFLSHAKYRSDLLHKTNMHGANPISTPMVSGHVLSTFQGEKFVDPHLYRSIVGALQYVTITRPELAYSVNKVCQFMHNRTVVHWQAVQHILRYLKGTFDYGLLLRKPHHLSLQGFADSDWASDPDDRRSTLGFCVYLGGNLITWSSKKQSIISRSSTEAEFHSLAHVATDLIWIQSLFSDLHLVLPRPPTLWCDNLGTVHLSANPILHSRTKHVELDIYFVRDLVLQKKVIVCHLPSSAQLANAQCVGSYNHWLEGGVKTAH